MYPGDDIKTLGKHKIGYQLFLLIVICVTLSSFFSDLSN